MQMLEEKRKQLNYSYKKMADMLKISKTYYWQLENNKRRMSYEMAIKIADIFKLMPDDLFYQDFKNKD